MAEQALSPAVDSRPKRLWVAWLLYFFQFAAIGVYFTYQNVYFREAGLSGRQIGLLNMVTALAGMGGGVAWGYLSDRSGRSRWLIAAGAAGSLLLAQFIPYARHFGTFLVLGTLVSLMGSAPGTLVDATVLALLGDRREEYGRYRLGGSIGYILTTLTVGTLFDRLGLRLMFPAYGVVMACFTAVALLLPASLHLHTQRGRGSIGVMFRRPAWVLFLFCMCLTWVASYASINFLSVSLNDMGASQRLIGFSFTAGAVVEIPFMFYSTYFLRRFGPVRLLMVAMGLYVLRYSLLGWMPSPGWAIAINMINGPAYVFYWNSAVTYNNRLAPPGMMGTAQGLLNAGMSLAGMISALLSGWLFDSLGANRLFLVMAFICAGALVLFGLGSLLFARRETGKADEPV